MIQQVKYNYLAHNKLKNCVCLSKTYGTLLFNKLMVDFELAVNAKKIYKINQSFK